MTTQTFDGYYVFEADQVLTNDHLNQQFYYLDWQERLTRNKLIGTGIVCGLDITSASGKITISKGSGVTSEGYLIVLEGPTTYDSFVQYSGVPQPGDLPFAPDLPTGYVLPFFDAYCKNTTVYQLLDSTQFTTQNPMPAGSAALSTFSNLGNYAVVLFLELNEKDLKNCDTQDCNNKGEKMEISIRALLVPVSALPNPFVFAKAKEIKLARYNVPYTAINDAAGVLNGFQKILKNGVLDKIALAYAYCFDRYKGILTSDASAQNPFSTGSPTFAQQLQTALTNAITKNNGLTIQYLYDYIDDLILAYYEFRQTANNVLLSQCVGHELDFPLHLVLGAANTSTDDMTADPFRTYFIYSAIFNAQNQGIDQTKFLFNRMQMLAAIPTIPLFQSASAIKVTPSQYMDFPLSERCIPFYYDPNAVNGTALNQVWNYYKSLHGNEDFVLGYNSSTYNSDDSVTSPLLYDIEKYNFFRVEGHIGQKYQSVLSHLLDQQLTYNLPFDIVAISAELLTTANVDIPDCNVVDLESEYRLLVIEFLAKMYLCFYKFSRLPYKEAALSNNKDTVKISVADIPEIDENAFLKSFTPTFSKYQYGDFITKYSPPVQATTTAPSAPIAAAEAISAAPAGGATTVEKMISISDTYGQFVKGGAIQNGVFQNPVNINSGTIKVTNVGALAIYNSQFSVLNGIDQMYHLLLNTTLANLTEAKFTAAYAKFNQYLAKFEANINKEEQVAIFRGCGCDCLPAIAKEILELIKEYQARVKQYLAQLSFLNYYKNHPGLEHKSGVPKGGTFVLVYHEAPATTTTGTAPSAPTNLGAVEVAPTNVARMAQPELTLQKGQYIINDATLEMVRKFVNDCTAASTPTKQGVLNNLPGSQQTAPGQTPPAATSIGNDVVIADFYIPYLCCSDCSPIAYLVPKSNLNVYNVTGGGNACANDTNNNAGISPIQLSNSDTDVKYTLSSSATDFTPITKQGTGTVLDFGVQTEPGTYMITATSADGNTKATMNGSAVVKINQPPAVFNLKTPNNTTSYCTGLAGVDIFLDGSESGVKYQLFNGTTADAAGPQTGNGQIVDFGVKPAGTYTVIATNPNGGCISNMNGSITLTAVPAPADQTVTGGGSFCDGSAGDGIQIGLANSENGVTYQLIGPSGQVADTATGSGESFNFKAQTAPGAYTVVASSAGGCQTTLTTTATITVLKMPSSQINKPAISFLQAPAARILSINITAVETDLSFDYAWNIDPNFFLQMGMKATQTDKRTWNITSNVPIADLVGRTKGRPEMKIALKVSNGQCTGQAGTMDLWAAMVAFAKANG